MRTLLKPNEQVRLLAISVDTHAQSKSFSDKIGADGKGPITFTMLSDPGHRVIDAYGLQDPQYRKLKQEGKELVRALDARVLAKERSRVGTT